MQNYTAEEEIQIARLEEGQVYLLPDQIRIYLESPDVLVLKVGDTIPAGYKKCGKCGNYKKLYLFNRNNSARNKCSGNCKECQSATSKKSYEKQKTTGKVKERYVMTREERLKRSKEYYEKNKDTVLKQQKGYHSSSKGKKVMKGAHAKRRYLLAKNEGIPWDRETIIDRDKMGCENPECILCGKPVTFDRDIHMEHLIPVVIGGANCFTNVAVAHQLCNLQKSKDAREVTVEQVESLIARSEAYMDAHPEKFEAFFKSHPTE